MLNLLALRALPWKPIGFGLVVAVLASLLLIEKGRSRHWEKKYWNAEQRVANEADAHRGTVENYRAAAEQARRADLENKARVEAEQRAINERVSNEYESRLAAARATAERLRREAATRANQSGAGTASVPGVSHAAGQPDGAAADHGFLGIDERLTATEQAIQLDALQKWVREQAGVKR